MFFAASKSASEIAPQLVQMKSTGRRYKSTQDREA
jgi:hypothetical protein